MRLARKSTRSYTQRLCINLRSFLSLSLSEIQCRHLYCPWIFKQVVRFIVWCDEFKTLRNFRIEFLLEILAEKHSPWQCSCGTGMPSEHEGINSIYYVDIIISSIQHTHGMLGQTVASYALITKGFKQTISVQPLDVYAFQFTHFILTWTCYNI